MKPVPPRPFVPGAGFRFRWWSRVTAEEAALVRLGWTPSEGEPVWYFRDAGSLTEAKIAAQTRSPTEGVHASLIDAASPARGYGWVPFWRLAPRLG